MVWERRDYEPARDPYDVAVGGGKAFYLQDNGKVFVLDFETASLWAKVSTARRCPR